MDERDPTVQKARNLERIGDFTAARKIVAGLVVSTSAAGATPWDLLMWLARLDVATGDTLRALKALAIVRKTEPEDRAFLAHSEMAVACLRAGDLETAETVIAELDDGHGSPEDLDATLRHVRAISIGGPRAPVLRIALLRLYAIVWSHRGRLPAAARAAAEALAQATQLVRGARIVDIALDLAELQLAAGDLTSAHATDTRIASVALDDDLASRWARHRVKRELLRGRLADAREHAVRLAALPEPRSLDARVSRALALAELEATFNQFPDAERIARRVREDVGPNHPQLRDSIDLFLRFNTYRASSTRDDVELPFLPEQVFDLSDPAGSAGAEDRPPLFSGTRSLPAPLRWSLAANELLLALQRGERNLDPQIAAIQAASFDSIYVRAKTEFYVTAARQRSGQLVSDAPFASIAAHLEAQGFVPAALQVRRHAGWAAARAGQIDRHLEHAREIRRLRDRMTDGLALRDKVFFMLNQWSAEDEYVSARALAAMRPGRPRRDQLGVSLDLFREVTSLTGWHLDDALAPAHAPRSAPPELVARSEIQQVIDRQLALVVRGRDRRFRLRSRWSLWRVPRNTTVLSFYVLADRVLVFAISFRRLDVRCLLVTRPMLDLAVRELHDTVQYRAPSKPTFAALDRVSRLLELPALLRDCRKQLVIVPHDVLHNVPFSALPCEDGRDVRVCERFHVSYLPDVGWLRRPRQRRPRTFAGVAVGNYAGAAEALPNAVAEADAIGRHLASLGWSSDLVVDPRPEQVVNALETHGWVHLACHGAFDRNRPHQSGLLLRAPEGGLERLTLDVLARAALDQLRLVVLAACWSAEAAVLPGHERVCLPAAFLRAGARSVIASLWQVYEESHDLLIDLYASVARVGPAAALSDIQARALRARPGTEYLWASLLHYGTP